MFVISKTNKYFALFEKFRSVGKKRGVRRCGEMVTENCHKHLDILIHRLMFVEYNTIDSTQNWLVTWNPALFKWTSLSLHTISCHQSGQSECKSGWQSLHFFSNCPSASRFNFYVQSVCVRSHPIHTTTHQKARVCAQVSHCRRSNFPCLSHVYFFGHDVESPCFVRDRKRLFSRSCASARCSCARRPGCSETASLIRTSFPVERLHLRLYARLCVRMYSCDLFLSILPAHVPICTHFATASCSTTCYDVMMVAPPLAASAHHNTYSA